jgi:hypothetical protein
MADDHRSDRVLARTSPGDDPKLPDSLTRRIAIGDRVEEFDFLLRHWHRESRL